MLARPRRVLIVHHDADMQEMLQTVLGQADIEASAVQTTDEALRDCTSATCDVVIIGWKEAVSGSIRVDDLAVSPEARQIRPLLVLCTGVDETRQVLGSRETCEYLDEPFAIEKFLDQVHHLTSAD